MPAVVEIRSGAARRQRSNTAPVGAAGARRGAGQSEGALVFTGPSWSYSSSRRSSGLWRSECRVPVATPASVSTRCRTWSTHCFTGQACVETSPHADCRALWNRRCPRPLVFVQPALAFVPHLSVCGGCRSATTPSFLSIQCHGLQISPWETLPQIPNHSPTQELAPLEHAPLPVNYCELLCRTRHFDYAAIVAAWSLYLAFAAQPAANMG